jgi:hypothetical protein
MRPKSLSLGAVMLVAAQSIPLTGAQADDLAVPAADVKPPSFRNESGATLRVLRPATFSIQTRLKT